MMLKKAKHFSKLIVGSIAVVIGSIVLLPAIATAPMPPQLVRAKLNGQPVHVLYLTRSGDKVLVRCYPGQQPNLVVTDKADGNKEGTLTCGN